MNIEKHLILVKDEDKTEQIESCKYTDGKWSVTYHNNSTEYTYSYQNVVWHRNPRVINHETYVVYESDQPLSGIIKILDFGDYLRILFKNGYKKLYWHSDIVIEENWLASKKASNCFEYLKKLADHTGIKFEIRFSCK